MYNTRVGALLLLIPCSMHYVTRSDMRMGSLIDMHFALDDVCVVCCFYSCALTQEAIQLERMTEAADSHYNENDSDNARIRLPQGAYIESFLLARTTPIRPPLFFKALLFLVLSFLALAFYGGGGTERGRGGDSPPDISLQHNSRSRTAEQECASIARPGCTFWHA
jgi:hypothetical protein